MMSPRRFFASSYVFRFAVPPHNENVRIGSYCCLVFENAHAPLYRILEQLVIGCCCCVSGRGYALTAAAPRPVLVGTKAVFGLNRADQLLSHH